MKEMVVNRANRLSIIIKIGLINPIVRNRKPTTGRDRSLSYRFPDMARNATP
jgi:hypothetical protein